jgi:hypothetical protein
MGGYAEKLLRLLVCEELQKQSPGIEYNASLIVNLRGIREPWKVYPHYQVPPLELYLLQLKQSSGMIIEAWSTKR